MYFFYSTHQLCQSLELNKVPVLDRQYMHVRHVDMNVKIDWQRWEKSQKVKGKLKGVIRLSIFQKRPYVKVSNIIFVQPSENIRS